ncbi:MAG TPA: aspartate aminotransferase family protein [Thermoleophilaceae bacterium]
MELSHDGLQQAAHDHLLLHFSRNGAFGPAAGELLVLDRGEGCHVWDTRGRRYVDGLSNLFCCQLGYSYGAEMAAAAREQLERLPFNTNWATAHPAAIELAERVAGIAPRGMRQVFFTSGGSEAVESAWKLVRQYHLANGEPERRKAIARRTAYHGVTLGALSFTGVEPFKEPFGPPAVPTRHVSNTNPYRSSLQGAELTRALLDELEQALLAEGPETVAMIIAEPVQNAGGCFVPPEGYWQGLRELADRHGILLVADEVITGFGRLGEWLGVHRYDAQPDLITVAKGLTAAYAPMGAVIVSERVAAPLHEADRTLLHGITFAGHPLAAAIALRSMEIFERDGVLENVRALEGHLAARLGQLRSLPIVGDVRGAGFFWALELVQDADGTPFAAVDKQRLVKGFMPGRLLEAGLIARADDRQDAVLQLAPPLVADVAVLDEIVDATAAVLEAAGTYMGVGSGAVAA